MSNRLDVLRRAHDYAKRKGVPLGAPLGSGVHGSVFVIASQTEIGRSAIKSHEHEQDYCRERDVYLRLKESGVTEIRGCAVPELLGYADDLWVIEMTVVSRPFVLDFAGAFLDRPPDFSEEVLADWRAEKQEQFGPRWGEVRAVLRELESYGVFLVDVNPGNVSFGD
jgi:hypothetical protein